MEGSDPTVCQKVTYQYYTIVTNESTGGEENGVVYVSFDNKALEVANDPPSNESILLPETEDVNNFELGVERKYVTLNQGTGLLRTMSSEDEHYDVIKPTLLNLNHSEETNDEQCIPQEVDIGTNLQLLEYSDDSNTAYSSLPFEIYPSEMNVQGETIEYNPEDYDNMYATTYSLSSNIKTDVNSKPFLCPVDGCDKSFSTSFLVNNHVKIHTGERPYMCTYCSKTFKTSGEVRKHSKVHTGIKPFPCPIEGCNRSFTTSNIRKVHIRSHTGERPYICEHPGCGKAFSSSANHKNHLRIHTGEKPFVCTVKGCNKRFTEYSTMYKHSTCHQNNACTQVESEGLEYSTMYKHSTCHQNNACTQVESEGFLLDAANIATIFSNL